MLLPKPRAGASSIAIEGSLPVTTLEETSLRDSHPSHPLDSTPSSPRAGSSSQPMGQSDLQWNTADTPQMSSSQPNPKLRKPEPTLIVIEDSPPRSLKPKETRPPKSAHPFFQSRKTAQVINLDDSDDPDEKVASSSTTRKGPSVNASGPPLPTKTPKSLKNPKALDSWTPLDAAWPNAISQHVNHHVSDSTSLSYLNRKKHLTSFPRRARLLTPLDVDELSLDDISYDSTWIAATQQSPTPPTHSLPRDPAVIPHEHRLRPALSSARFKYDVALRSDLNPMWVDKYRPRRAGEVLGNEEHATYIRDWLLALELTLSSSRDTASGKGKGKRTLLKGRAGDKADRKRGKRRKLSKSGYDHDWVVADGEEEEEEEVDYDDDDEDTFLASLAQSTSRSSSPMKLSARYSSVPPLPIPSTPFPSMRPSEPPEEELYTPPKTFNPSEPLTNVLLLMGPPGAGKTAAVYACAEELGWEVFEMNPGMGKRSASVLTNLLDGVGRNHTLKGGVKETMGGSAIGKKRGLLEMMLGAKSKSAMKGSRGNEIVVVDSSDPPEPHSDAMDIEDPTSPSPLFQPQARIDKFPGPSASKAVNQSIILLEEADILFQGEGGFWGAVMDIIRDSRRPIIMTCNGTVLLTVLPSFGLF